MSPSVARLVRDIAAAVMFGCCIAAHAQPVSPPPPIEHFFGNPRFSMPAFSPDGKLLAIVTAVKGQRDALRVIALETNKAYATAAYRDADIASFQWINDNRLIFNVADRSLAQSEVDIGPGLYAVNADGSDMRQLAQRKWSDDAGRMRVPYLSPYTSIAPQPGLQNSDTVYVNQAIYRDDKLAEVELLALDTRTGRSTRVSGPPGTTGWLLDDKGEPRVASSSKEQIATVHWRQPGSKDWKKLTSFNVFVGSEGAFTPIAFGADGTLYVLSSNGDKSAVHTFSAATGKVSAEPLIETTGYDFNGNLVMKNGVLQGFRFTTDALATYWLDPVMKALQAEIDAKLVGTINTISVPRRGESPWVLVTSFSDVLPVTILLYNKTTKAFKTIGSSHPDIKHEQMGTQEAVTYKARDGMSIPGLLTLPKGQRKNLPMVVLVHGGPSVDGAAWGWDAETQFLASRGYAVLEPSFRGTTGLGYAHHKAGWRQWGLAMQDDVADGVRWAIKQGIADGARVCIAGASYGGYATLMGMIKDPDLYKCGVSWLGVTDLSLLHKSHWLLENDMSDVYRKYGFPELVGDPVKDAEQFKATSPLLQAAKLKQPLLLSYGGADRRVPLNHGTKFRDAVKQTNNDVEWVVYPNEGHGYALEENRIDFYKRVERFLERNIGKAAPAK